MKFVLLTIVFLLFFHSSFSQSVAISSDGSLPHTSAILDVKSSGKGMLLPRTSTSSRLAIANPAKGLIVYDTTASGFWFYNGSAWSQLSAGSSNGWQLTGNAGTNPANHFFGTTDEQPLRFRVNNSWAGELHPTSGNVFLGVGAGKINTIGEGNTAIGEHSLFTNSVGNFSTAYGYYSLAANTTGFNNTANGSYALTNNTTGNSNTAAGRNALFVNTTGGYNTAVGEGALLANNGDENSAYGYHALFSNISGNSNTATGVEALQNNTSGNFNTAHGFDALYANTTGSSNTANGSYAMFLNSTGSFNTASGFDALQYNTTGSSNTANGSGAMLFNSTGSFNAASGSSALKNNTTGNNNTASGFQALYDNSSGGYNTAVGMDALHANTTAYYNTAIGESALVANTTGISNTAIGFSSGKDIRGNYNIAIGIYSGVHPNTPNIDNTVSIGNGDMLNAYQNQVFLGNTSTGFIGGKVNWGVVSDARIKNTIKEDVKGLDFILRLRPVTYHISNKAMTDVTGNKETPDFPGKYDVEKVKYTGFIAQEVEAAAKAAGYDFSGYEAPKNQWSLYTIRYAEFVVPLVKAMQEQQAVISDQQKQIELLEKRLAALEAKQ